MKNRAESLDSDLDLLRAAFSEISRLVTEVSDTAESESAEGEKKEVILEFWPPSPPTPPLDWHRQLLVATDSCINEPEP